MSNLIESFFARLPRRLPCKKGQTLVEYTLILAILTIVMVAVMKLLGGTIVVVFSSVANLLDTAQVCQ